MHPILFKIGPLTVYSYGVCVALGFAAAAFFIYRRAAHFGIDKDSMIDLLIIMLISGVIGARALYVALNLGYYIANPMQALNLSGGGLVWYGGFLAALGSSAVYLKTKRCSFMNIMDLISPYAALAQSFGRIGCFLNGCCYGFSGIPVQIYSSILLFAMFIILRLWQDKRRFEGEIFLGYCTLYSLKRFGIEFARGDNPRILAGLTISQVISLAVILIAVPVFIIKVRKWREKGTASR